MSDPASKDEGHGSRAAGFLFLMVTSVGWGVNWLLGIFGISLAGPAAGFLEAAIYFIVAAVVLMISARILSGFVVSGFVGALIAALAIAVVNWVIAWLLGLFGITVPTVDRAVPAIQPLAELLAKLV